MAKELIAADKKLQEAADVVSLRRAGVICGHIVLVWCIGVPSSKLEESSA